MERIIHGMCSSWFSWRRHQSNDSVVQPGRRTVMNKCCGQVVIRLLKGQPAYSQFFVYRKINDPLTHQKSKKPLSFHYFDFPRCVCFRPRNPSSIGPSPFKHKLEGFLGLFFINTKIRKSLPGWSGVLV